MTPACGGLKNQVIVCNYNVGARFQGQDKDFRLMAPRPYFFHPLDYFQAYREILPAVTRIHEQNRPS